MIAQRTADGRLRVRAPGSIEPRSPIGWPRRWRPSVATALGLPILLLVAIVAVVGPVLPLPSPAHQDLVGRLTPPIGFGGNVNHPLGTDGLGRDLLARVVAGARVSVLVGVTATLVAGAIGVTLGLLAGVVGGVVDRLVTWIIDVVQAIPFVVFAIAALAVLDAGLGTVILVLAATGWVAYARVVRLESRALRSAPFVDAARALGASRRHLILRHVLPNVLGPVLVLASQQVAAMVLYEAGLSYLGLGVPGDVVTWGGMVAAGQDALFEAWWVSAVPGAALAIMVLGLTLVGDRLSR